MNLCVSEEHHRAELHRLAREARQANPGWATRERCRFLCRLGLVLVSLGRRLLAANTIPAASAAQQALAP